MNGSGSCCHLGGCLLHSIHFRTKGCQRVLKPDVFVIDPGDLGPDFFVFVFQGLELRPGFGQSLRVDEILDFVPCRLGQPDDFSLERIDLLTHAVRLTIQSLQHHIQLLHLHLNGPGIRGNGWSIDLHPFAGGRACGHG
ncbi:hypothetical protein DSECCO2_487640 [anaerobic digester metagenome]